MKQFDYTITDPLGIHARPAGLLAQAAKEFAGTTVTITKGDTTAKSSQLIKLMSLCAKKGDVVTVSADGPDEDAAISAMQIFFRENL